MKQIFVFLILILNNTCVAQNDYPKELWMNDQLYLLDTINEYKYFTKDTVYIVDEETRYLLPPVSMEEFASMSNTQAKLAIIMKNNATSPCISNSLFIMSYSAFLDSVQLQYVRLKKTSTLTLCDVYKSLCYNNVIDEKIITGNYVSTDMMNYKILFDSIFNVFCRNNPDKYQLIYDGVLLDNVIYDIGFSYNIGMAKLLELYKSCPIKKEYLEKKTILLIHINSYEIALSIFGYKFRGTPHVTGWP